ncbi:MAG: hypothetical protein JXC85_04315 [Candidatus Aenigmarchaeota archaeon]|nr:hypothetical protein [Candidatus Aenigmarchaeota archaeon]
MSRLNAGSAVYLVVVAMAMHALSSPDALAQTCQMNGTIITPDSDVFLRGRYVMIESYLDDCEGNPISGATNTMRVKHSDSPNELPYWESCFNMSEAGGIYSCYWRAPDDAKFGWYDVRLDAQKSGYGTASAMKRALYIGYVPEIRSVSVSPLAGSPWTGFDFKVQVNDDDHSWNNITLLVSKDNDTWKEIKTVRVKPQPAYSLTMEDVIFTPDDEGARYFKFVTVDDISHFAAESGAYGFKIYDCGDGTCDPDEHCMTCPSDCGYCKSARIDVIDIASDAGNVIHPATIVVTSTIECSGMRYESPYLYGVLDCSGAAAEIHLAGDVLGLAPGEESVHQLGTMENGSKAETSWTLVTLPKIRMDEAPLSIRINVSARESTNCTNGSATSDMIYVTYRCGNGVCDEGESNCTCPFDCGNCSGVCGVCKGYACVNSSCACTTMGDCCGNSVCDANETYSVCPGDCTPECGNGACEAPNETHSNCCEDCGCTNNQTCRNGACVDERPRICVPDAIRCSAGNLHLCSADGTDWLILRICEHGCSEYDLTCNPAGGSDDSAWYVLAVLAMAAALLAYAYRRKRKSRKPLSLEEALDGFYGA